MKRIAVISVAILALLLGGPFLIPTEAYLKRVEQAASKKIGQPVAIGSLHFSLLPTPRANLGYLVMGRNSELQVEDIAVVPQIGSLLSDNMVISSIVVTRPVVQKAALDFIGSMPGTTEKTSSATPELRHLRIREARLEWPGFKIPAMNAELELTVHNQLKIAFLSSVDERMRLEATPKGEAYALQLVARQWTLPVGPPLMFDTLKSDMTLQGSRLDIHAFDAQLYQGKLAANALLAWDKGLQASGKFRTEGIQVGEAARLFGSGNLISGRLTGEGGFRASAKDTAAAMEQLAVDYRFDVAKGVLHGVDLAKAATLLLNQGEKGGETQFDEIHGMLHTQGKRIDLRDFKVTSGLLEAHGGVTVSPARKLDGKIEVELKKGVALVSVPLRVSGTLDQPQVLPTKVALAGAAIGTGVLGPGLGTSLGIKAASGVEKVKGLFGSSP